jgi:hypothetical protein
LLSDVQPGDQLAVKIEDWRYLCREVTYINESEKRDIEITVGDPEGVHIVLVVDTYEELRENVDLPPKTKYDVWGYTINDDPDDPINKRGDVEAIALLGDDNMELPDKTLDEALEDADIEGEHVEEDAGLAEMREVRDNLEYVIDQLERVNDNEMTLSEYEERLECLAVRNGGDFRVEV